MVAQAGIAKQVTIVRGGETRQDSVESALRALPHDTDIVAVHDAVRPFVSIESIEEVIAAAKAAGVTMYLTGTRHFFH